jgi:CRISPR-associated protein Csm5
MTAATETAIPKPNLYDSQQIQLSSPILHIGSVVQQLYPSEYVATNNRIYYPDTNALARILEHRGRRTDFLNLIDNRGDLTVLLRDTLGENWTSTTDATGKPIFPKHLSIRCWAEQTMSLLRPLIRTGLGQPYIPGSSIKGAIRTAIAYHLIKYANRYNVPLVNRVSEIEQKLRQSMGVLRRKAQFIDDSLLMDALFTDFDLNNPRQLFQRRGDRKGPNTDFMRAIHVTDSAPIIEEQVEQRERKILRNSSVVAEVIVSSHFPDHRAKYRASIFAELVCNVRTTFTLQLDAQMLDWFQHTQGMQIPFASVQDILNICHEFTQDQWDFEHDHWMALKNNPNAAGRNLDFSEIRNLYTPEKCPFGLRLGWGSGMMGTTIGLGLNDKLRAEIRDTVGIQAPGFDAPKSRRTVVSAKGEIKYVPGWIKLKVM